MIGMGALSIVIAVPLAVSARGLTWANSGLQGAVGTVTIAIGVEQPLGELVEHGRRDGVHPLGRVEGDGGDVVRHDVEHFRHVPTVPRAGARPHPT